FKLTAATVHLLPQWFELLSGIMANKQILHVINSKMIQPAAANSLTLANATAADNTLHDFTAHQNSVPANSPVLYYCYTDTANTFPGTLSQQFNASRLIRLNLKSSFASTLPRTNFAYDSVKYILGLYIAHTANPAVINKKLRSITAYWNDVSTLLNDLKALNACPEVLPHIQFDQIKCHLINCLHFAFGSVKAHLYNTPTITDKSTLLTAFLIQEHNIGWTPSTVALTTGSG
ncbi:hypothetical protein HDU80_000864, partial [Chytriomyces hyalinus]